MSVRSKGDHIFCALNCTGDVDEQNGNASGLLSSFTCFATVCHAKCIRTGWVYSPATKSHYMCILTDDAFNLS